MDHTGAILHGRVVGTQPRNLIHSRPQARGGKAYCVCDSMPVPRSADRCAL